MWGVLWTVVGCVLAVNAVVLAGVVVSAAREAHRSTGELAEPNATGRAGRRSISGSRRPSVGGTLAGWSLVAVLLLTGTAFASPHARELVGSVLGTVAGGLGVGHSERASATGGDRPALSGSDLGAAGTVGAGSRSSTGGSGDSASDTTGSTLRAPARVTALAESSTEITLSWIDVANESGYRVERRSNEGVDWIEVAVTDPGVTTVTDSGLFSGTTYFYRVFAIDAGADSLPSNLASATTITAPPASPTVAAYSSPTEIVLEWGDVAGATGYRIERSVDGATGWIAIATTGRDIVHYSDSGLPADATFYYRIFAMNAGGDSQASNVAAVTTPTDTPSAEVTDTPSPEEVGADQGGEGST